MAEVAANRIVSLGAVIMLFLAVAVLPGSAEGIRIEGTVDCGNWHESRSNRSAVVLEGYLLGLINGLAVGAKTDFWRYAGNTLSREQVYLWMDNYCRSSPLSTVLTGAVALMEERTSGAFGRRIVVFP